MLFSGAVVIAPKEAEAKLWISGKSDINRKDLADKTGTKKDTKFLRCLSNCVSDCQKPTGGQPKDRDECLLECQEGCCTTYEQCTCTLNPGLV